MCLCGLFFFLSVFFFFPLSLKTFYLCRWICFVNIFFLWYWWCHNWSFSMPLRSLVTNGNLSWCCWICSTKSFWWYCLCCIGASVYLRGIFLPSFLSSLSSLLIVIFISPFNNFFKMSCFSLRHFKISYFSIATCIKLCYFAKTFSICVVSPNILLNYANFKKKSMKSCLNRFCSASSQNVKSLKLGFISLRMFGWAMFQRCSSYNEEQWFSFMKEYCCCLGLADARNLMEFG